VLNQKYQQAQEHDIDVQMQVNDLSSVSIYTDHLVVLLSNLLDNAIEACL
jgi:sensor histidine kinase regulating citrate/malate metabolism